MPDYAIGVDVGGTKIAAVLLNRQGKVAAKLKQATEPSEGAANVVQRIADCICELEARADGPVCGAGVGVAGAVDHRRRIAVAAVNLGWFELPIGELLLEHLGKSWDERLRVDKDTNAAAMAELLYGAGRDAEHFLYVTVGTGVGAGLVLDGRLYHGPAGGDGNIGHLALKPEGELCACGKRGCVETVSSGPAIARRAIAALRRGEESSLSSLSENSITAVDVVEAAKRGDRLSGEVLDEAGCYLGRALAYYADLMNPERIIIGGGVLAAGDLFLEPVRQTIDKWALPVNAKAVEILPAKLADAGAIGAACLVWHQHERSVP